jgi:hypothetical protein
VWREQDDVVTELLEAACPVVGRAAGFHDDGGGRLLSEEVEEVAATHAHAGRLDDAARAVGDGDLENSLRDVDADASSVLHDGLLLVPTSTDSGTSMPIESAEESIPSLGADETRGVSQVTQETGQRHGVAFRRSKRGVLQTRRRS